MEIVIIACLLVAPETCSEHSVGFDAERQVTPYQCVMQAMPSIAQWGDLHPKWRVVRFRCEEPGRKGRAV